MKVVLLLHLPSVITPLYQTTTRLIELVFVYLFFSCFHLSCALKRVRVCLDSIPSIFFPQSISFTLYPL